MHMASSSKDSLKCDIPVSWFNFIILMLATPEKFNLARNFLVSPLWEIIKEPITKENTIYFIIPNESFTHMAPPCLGADNLQSAGTPSTPSKKRKGKEPLVESAVSTSPR